MYARPSEALNKSSHTQVFTVYSNCCNAHSTPCSPNCMFGQIIDFSASFLNMHLFFQMLVFLFCLSDGYQRQQGPCRRHSWFKVLFRTFNLFHSMDHTLFCQFKCTLIWARERNTVRPLKLDVRKQKPPLLLHEIHQRVYMHCRIGCISQSSSVDWEKTTPVT